MRVERNRSRQRLLPDAPLEKAADCGDQVRIAALLECRLPFLVGFMAFMTPLATLSQAGPPPPVQTAAQTPPPVIPPFEVTSVKPTRVADGRWRLSDTHEGWSGMDVGLLILVQTAY